jgi:flavin-dependent dehydrogenase
VTEAAELLVVGGGPAGLATALCARLAGFDVLLVEAARPPIDRACGEGLMPDGVAQLRRLGVDVSEVESAAFRGIRYLDGGVVATGELEGEGGLGIRRVDLHRAMWQRADALGVSLRWGVRVRALHSDAVETDDGELRAHWLVAADGRSSRIRAWAGLDGARISRKRHGVRRHYAIEPWSEFVEVYWTDRAEAYVTPVGRGTVGVAMLSQGGGAGFDALLPNFPALEERLRGAPVASRDRGGGPFGRRARSVVRGRLALVGDASGSLDPITGEGLSAAFHQAAAVVEAIEAGELSSYASAHRRIMRPPRLMTGLLLAAERRPWLRRRVIRALAESPSLFNDLLRLRTSGRLPGLWGRRGILSLASRLALHGV